MAEQIGNLELIHYGNDQYIPQLTNNIKNREGWCKPFGGLWVSPSNSDYGWKQWCIDNDYNFELLQNKFTISLKENTRIFKIEDLLTLKKLPCLEYKIGSFSKYYLDFEKISTMYDCIWLTEKGEQETRFSAPIDLYGWDCESILIMNKNCIKK